MHHIWSMTLRGGDGVSVWCTVCDVMCDVICVWFDVMCVVVWCDMGVWCDVLCVE